MSRPTLREMSSGLTAAQFVSGANPSLDTSNETITTRLAEWLSSLGFSVERCVAPAA